MDARVFYLGPGEHYRAVLSAAGIPVQQVFKRGQPLRMLIGLSKALFRFKPHVVLASQFTGKPVPRWADEGMAVLTEPAEKVELHRRNLARCRQEGQLFEVGRLMQLADYPQPLLAD